MKNFVSYCFLVFIFIFSSSSSVIGMDFDLEEGGQQSPIRIIIAEDELVTQKIYANMFQKPSYEVTIVNNGKELCATYLPGLFNVILTDGNMPLMDGYEAIATLVKKYGKDKLPPIIAISADTLEKDREKFFTAGAQIVLSKPIEKKTVLETIHSFLTSLSYELPNNANPNAQE